MTVIDQWPGGRTPLIRGQYLPRYLTKLPKDQQAVLATSHAWQPSKSNRKICGIVPTRVLKHFQELADRENEEAVHEGEDNHPAHARAQNGQKGSQIGTGTHDGDESPSILKTSQSEVSEVAEWSSSPRSPMPRRRALPQSSSPLHEDHRRHAQPFPRLVKTANSTDAFHTKLQTTDSQNLEPPREDGTALSTAQSPQPNSEVKRYSGSILCDAPHDQTPTSSSMQTQTVRMDNFTGDDVSSNLPGSDHTLQDVPSGAKAIGTGEDQCQGKERGKTHIHVHRTPFAQQQSAIGRRAVHSSQAANEHDAKKGESGLDLRDHSSSASRVPATFVQQKRANTVPQPDLSRSSHGVPNGLRTADGTAPNAAPERQVFKSPCTNEAFRATQHLSSQRGSTADSSHLVELRGTKRKRVDREPVSSNHSKARFASCERDSNEIGNAARVKTANEIARESRRTFFRQKLQRQNPAEGTESGGSDSDRDALHSRVSKTESQISYETASPAPSCQPKSRKSKERLGGSPNSHTMHNIYEIYKAAYPDYQGPVSAFEKACRQIQLLDKEKRAPHPYLWDDFIFCRHHHYRLYLLRMAETSEDALPYLEYYHQHVERPLRTRSIVQAAWLTRQTSDSVKGSSVESANCSASTDIIRNLDQNLSQRSSSSVESNRTSSVCAVSILTDKDNGWQTKQDHIHASVVKTWVRQQSIERFPQMPSPQLGSTESSRADETAGRTLAAKQLETAVSMKEAKQKIKEGETRAEEVPEEAEMEAMTNKEDEGSTNTAIPASSPPLPSSPPSSPPSDPARTASISRQVKQPTTTITSTTNTTMSRWYQDPDTPFKNFVRAYNSLPHVKAASARTRTISGSDDV